MSINLKNKIVKIFFQDKYSQYSTKNIFYIYKDYDSMINSYKTKHSCVRPQPKDYHSILILEDHGDENGFLVFFYNGKICWQTKKVLNIIIEE